jgi:carbamoyl-phosphate synthase large subunit
VLALAAIALFILRGPAGRRVVGLLLSAGLIFACNVLRISGSVWVGLHLGSPALVLFHDWVGTLFALAYTMTGFFLLLFFLLPSATARIPRAARVSDVL